MSVLGQDAAEGTSHDFSIFDCLELVGECKCVGLELATVHSGDDCSNPIFEIVSLFAKDGRLSESQNCTGCPIYFVSALENKGVDKLLESAFRMYSKMNSTIPTGKLNAAVKKLLDANPPRYISGKRLKVYYCVKTSSRPFTVKMFCNSLQSFTDPYKRYLVNGIRDSFKLGGVAIRLDLIGKVSQTIQERFQNKK